ncbi:proton-coupled folate transporter-like [Glandiceps talaboti]
MFKENSNGRRWRVIATLTNNMVVTTVINSAPGLTVLYIMQYPFCWSAIIIGYYTAALLFVNAIGILVGGKLLMCCLTDLAIVQVAVLSYMCSLMVIAFAYNTPMMFSATLAGVFSFLAVPVLNSKLSKLVTESEQGTIFATSGSCESIGMFFSPIIFNTIYAETVSNLPGTVFVTMAASLIVSVIVTAILQIKEPKSGYMPLPGKAISSDSDLT